MPKLGTLLSLFHSVLALFLVVALVSSGEVVKVCAFLGDLSSFLWFGF
jgi:hypothetical protein